jgi:hypothetical protein
LLKKINGIMSLDKNKKTAILEGVLKTWKRTPNHQPLRAGLPWEMKKPLRAGHLRSGAAIRRRQEVFKK